ncbi:MAG: FAD:protein FMN transferase [Planctomycetaceae bacterium]
MQTNLRAGMFGACLLAAIPVAAAEPAPVEQLERYEFFQIQMGTPFKITLYSPDEDTANTASRAAFRRVKQLNAIFSDYDPDSETSQFCRRSGPGKPVALGSEMQHVLTRAIAVSQASEGAFDVTVGPVVKLWRKARRKQRLPDASELAAARQLVGYQLVRIDAAAGTGELLKPGMQLDFGGIVQGYAADEALAVLRRHSIKRALIDASGDVVAGDPPPGRNGWTIGIGALTKPDEPPTHFLSLKNAAVATSGDAYQALEIDGVRYSHIVDPKTGVGLTRRSSVTVVAADGITVDGLSTAVSVLGPERGLQLIERTKGADALCVELHDGKPREFRSRNFGAYEVQQPVEAR